MFFLSRNNGSRSSRRERSPDRQRIVADPPEKSKGLISHSLKDLFVSSPPLEDNGNVTENARENRGISPTAISSDGDSADRRGGVRSPRPILAAFRCLETRFDSFSNARRTTKQRFAVMKEDVPIMVLHHDTHQSH
ncbi:hypothetical protein HHK36_014948 [Tetracentron sinense]|uniref:Uncharacterized protein n=1 Tax=Tetracentron sinense TaxID=13715 RepID=A0A834ZA69_TETSI|nr:hypothetical protein HHK36_014948 [Tetracentron sinense]